MIIVSKSAFQLTRSPHSTNNNTWLGGNIKKKMQRDRVAHLLKPKRQATKQICTASSRHKFCLMNKLLSSQPLGIETTFWVLGSRLAGRLCRDTTTNFDEAATWEVCEFNHLTWSTESGWAKNVWFLSQLSPRVWVHMLCPWRRRGQHCPHLTLALHDHKMFLRYIKLYIFLAGFMVNLSSSASGSDVGKYSTVFLVYNA